MLEVIKPGLETSVQDYPGRFGYLSLGFPWSGAMDSWSLRLANVLVGYGVQFGFRDLDVVSEDPGELDFE